MKTIHFVGAGSGAADLITLRGKQQLEEADIIIYAGSLVNPDLLNYAKEAGVPAEDIFCDHAGFSTYDSMYRAGSIFGAERVIVVTQEYHQYRSLYIGKKLGLTVCGVASDQRDYFGTTYRELREMLARFKDVFKALLHSKPLLGGDAIPISGSGLISHDE